MFYIQMCTWVESVPFKNIKAYVYVDMFVINVLICGIIISKLNHKTWYESSKQNANNILCIIYLYINFLYDYVMYVYGVDICNDTPII